MRVELDARLNMLAALTPACSVAADVGADHGFLGAWLIENRRCERVQFLDISAPSLNKARKLIEEMQLEQQVLTLMQEQDHKMMMTALSMLNSKRKNKQITTYYRLKSILIYFIF